MITSDKQYTAAKKQLTMLEKSLLSPKKEGVPPVIEKAGKAQIKELMAEINSNINEYDKLRKEGTAKIKIDTMDDLMLAPIRYRIAKKMTVDAFGRKVGINARQITRYEKACYKNISASTFGDIIEKINVKFAGTIKAKKPKRVAAKVLPRKTKRPKVA